MRIRFVLLILFSLSACAGPLLHDSLTSQTASRTCLKSGSEQVINSALVENYADVELCPSAEFIIKNPIVLGKTGQRLSTLSTDDTSWRPARIIVDGVDQSTAIFSRASGVRIENLYVDGMRRKLGRIARGGALIELGGDKSTSVQVRNVRALDPRGWSTIHLFEGDKTCTGALIEKNHVGPAGGPNGEWADGLSIACANSVVRQNIIEDASDGGIVIFGAPGTVVENNVVMTSTNTLLGGINLVDYKPYDGDYTGTVVRENRITALGGFIKIGIAVGPSVWGADNTHFVRGATIVSNEIDGSNIGYAIAVDGANDVKISDNKISSIFNGKKDGKCYGGNEYPDNPYVVNTLRSDGFLQPGFADVAVRYAICISKKQ